MPLPPSVPREALHHRQIELHGYRRGDGLYDIEARMVDRKAHDLTLTDGRMLPRGQPIHDMSIRLVVDDDLAVIDVAAATDSSPFGICAEATAALQAVKGMRMVSGWSNAIKQLFAGRAGCTHLTELLLPLATVAFQTLSPVRLARPAPVDASGRPRKIDSCYAYASDREIVLQRWPEHYDGPAARPATSDGRTAS